MLIKQQYLKEEQKMDLKIQFQQAVNKNLIQKLEPNFYENKLKKKQKKIKLQKQ
jgi:hypothetical protein